MGGFILEGGPEVDVNGVYLLVGYLFLVSAYLGSCWFGRWRKSRNRMAEIDGGKFRLAASTGNVEALQAIKDTVADFDINVSVNGFTALHAACSQGQVNAVLWLCRNGADVDAVKNDGWLYTPIHYAASQGHLHCVKVLCAFGADWRRQTFSGDTAAQIAADQGHRNISFYLSNVATGAVKPQSSEYDGRVFRRDYQGAWKTIEGQVQPLKSIKEYMVRGNEGIDTPGTIHSPNLQVFRVLALVYIFTSMCYLIWRVLRSLNPGWWYFYSVPFWLFEALGWTLGLCFVFSLYYQIERPPRDIAAMLEPEDYPKTDIFIVRYSESVEVLEATVVAALNVDYPGEKLCVYILDDGNSPDVRDMFKRIKYQLKYMDRKAGLRYIARKKVKGVPHHAKAGNINNCLLCSSSSDTDYILVLDCDMIIHPKFLRRTLGHFLVKKGDIWCKKDFAGLLQTPQDFWNVDSEDPMVHCARFFYGPMLQGRDGVGCCPCCGTGVLFKRDILVSVGGQSYGSITEDCNTAMQLLSAGFANMFLNERLVYGMAPEDIAGVFKQRLRWAMGALQILYRDNPLRKRGLTLPQSLLFFEIGAHHYLAIGTLFMTIVPVLYVYVQASPLTVRYLWEFCIVFAVFFISNRLMIWWAHRGCSSGGELELWRGGQMWIWMSPNHIKAILKTFVGEVKLFRFLKFEIAFQVTDKDKTTHNVLESLGYTWPFLIYIFSVIFSLAYFIVTAALGRYSVWEIVMLLTALSWASYICLCIWPPVSILIPRIETEQGWKIAWDTAIDEEKFAVDQKNRVIRKPKKSLTKSDSAVIEGMEKGTFFKMKDLTQNVLSVFQPTERPESDEIDFASPFDDSIMDSEQMSTEDLEIRPRSRLGSGLSSFVDGVFGKSRNKSSTRLKSSLVTRLSENIGRVAMPLKTAEMLAKSGLYTSVILPEPMRASRLNSNRPDVRTVSLDHLSSQFFSKSLVLSEKMTEEDIGRRISEMTSQLDKQELSYKRSFMEEMDTLKSGAWIRNSMNADMFGLAMTPSDGPHNISMLGHSHLEKIQEEEDKDDGNQTGDPLQRSMSQRNVSGKQHPQRKSLMGIPTGIYATNNGRVYRGDQEIPMNLLTKTVVAELQLHNDSRDFTSPFTDAPGNLSAGGSSSVSAKGFRNIKVTESGRVFEGDREVSLGNLMHNVVAELNLNPEDNRSSNDFASPFLDKSDNISSNIPSHPVADLKVTNSGRVFDGNREVGLGHLMQNVVAQLNLNQESSDGNDFTSPFGVGARNQSRIDLSGQVTSPQIHGHLTSSVPENSSRTLPEKKQTVQDTDQVQKFLSQHRHLSMATKKEIQPQSSDFARMLSIPVEVDRRQASRFGKDLIRSMTQSYKAELAYEGQEVIDLQRNIGATSVILGRKATDTLGSRVFSQPGSIMISAIFMQLSQMQPTLLERKGIVLPVIPDTVFEHTLASKPNFEFRVLPSKTVMFFVVNIVMLAGVTAGGILAIFFAGSPTT